MLQGWHINLAGFSNMHHTVTLSSFELVAVSKAMPTLKVPPWREFLADSATYSRDVH